MGPVSSEPFRINIYRNGPRMHFQLSLESTLISQPASVDSKPLTAKPKPFRCNTYKKHRGGPHYCYIANPKIEDFDSSPGHGTRITGHGYLPALSFGAN